MKPCILITNQSKWNNIFHTKLIFKTLTDEHVLRILFLQKIKISKSINDIVKIYLDDIELDEMNIHPKLLAILKYESCRYNIEIININNGYNIDEVREFNKHISKNTERV